MEILKWDINHMISLKTNRKLLIEKNDIRLNWIIYLTKLRNNRLICRPIVYTDEIYVHSTHATTCAWSDETNKGLKFPISKGPQVIIVRACTERGFVSNALLIYKFNQKSGDYHSSKNRSKWQKWVKENLMPWKVILF